MKKMTHFQWVPGITVKKVYSNVGTITGTGDCLQNLTIHIYE